MRRFLSMVLVAGLLVTMAGCSIGKEPAGDNGNTPTERIEATAVYEQSRKLSEEVLNYYLGKDYNTAYTGFIHDAGITKLTSENRTIYLPDQAASRVLYGIQQGAYYASVLKAASAGAGGGESADDLLARMDQEIVKLLDEHIFINGAIPDVLVFDTELRITQDFIQWFIHQAQQSGTLDKRLTFTEGTTSTLTVNSQDCGESKGGLKFNILGDAYEIPATEVGVTADDLMKSPNFIFDVTNYRFYDTGIFTIEYATKSSNAVTQRHTIKMTFRYAEPAGEYEDVVSKFLAGVKDFKLIHK